MCIVCGYAQLMLTDGEFRCRKCQPSVFSAMKELSRTVYYTRSTNPRSRVIYMLLDSGSNCHIVKDDFYLWEIKLQNLPIGGVHGTAESSKKRGKFTAWVKSRKKSGETEKTRMVFDNVNHLSSSHLNILSLSRLFNQNCIIHFQRGNSYIIMADGTRIDLIEKNGLFYLRLEQIFEPDEIRAMVAMTPAHQRPPILKGKMALGASVDLWHRRLHISPKRIQMIYDSGAIEGFGLQGKATHGKDCSCEACQIARASRRHVPTARRYDPLCDKPFHTVSSDVKVVNTESLGGFRYAVNFVDGYTSLHCLFMWTKNEVTTKLEEFISDF